MLVKSERQIDRLLQEVEQQSETFVDLETTGLDPRTDTIVGAAVKPAACPARYISIGHAGWNLERGRELLAEVVEKAFAISNHHLSFDLAMLSTNHITDTWRVRAGRDSELAIRLLDENSTHKLKPWSVKVFGPEAGEPNERLDELGRERGWKKVKAHMADLRAEEVEPYACQDVVLVERALDYADPRLEALGLQDIAEEYYQMGLLLTGMYVDGIPVSQETIARLQHESEVLAASRATYAREAAPPLERGQAFLNFNSPPQMRRALDTWTTEAWMVRALARDGNELAKRLLSYRRMNKAREFYDGYQMWMWPDGRLHPRWRVIRTGRISYADPNLHSTPHYSDDYRCKECFVAEPGCQLVLLDWSQAEAKLCAHYNLHFHHDRQLYDLFQRGEDFHDFSALRLSLTRDSAKTFNYAAFYGMGPLKYSREHGTTLSYAKQTMQKYHATIPGPRQLYREMEQMARARNQIRLWDGSYRRFDYVRTFPQHASNSLLQGGVGSMARRAMLRLRGALDPSRNERWLLQIHDALLAQIDGSRGPDFLRALVAEMQRFSFAVPMTVDCKVGKRWSEMKGVKL